MKRRQDLAMKPMFHAPLPPEVTLTTAPDPTPVALPVPDVVPTQPILAPGEAALLRTLVDAGSTATTMQIHRISTVRPQETFALAVSLAAFGLVTLQHHPLLPNHATLRVTPFGRRVAADETNNSDRDQPASGERRLRLLPGNSAPVNNPKD